MLDHFVPLFVLSLAGGFLGSAVVVLTSRIEPQGKERHH
jgi:hypothetical protein